MENEKRTMRGTVVKLTDIKSGVSKKGYAWASQQVVIDISSEEPKLRAFDFEPDKLPEFAALQRGDEVEIAYYYVCSEGSTGNYFTQLKAKSLVLLKQVHRAQVLQPHPAAAAAPTPAPAPKAAAPKKTEAAAFSPSMDTDESDDLPF
jgi:hypothetical protein